MADFQSYGSVAAAGSTWSDATLLTYHVNIITGADETKGVKLPIPNPNLNSIFVYNNTQAKAVKIYGHLENTDTILPIFGQSSRPYILTGYKYLEFKRVSTTTWIIADANYVASPQSIAATGSNQSNAAQLELGPAYYLVSGADGTKGVKLPACALNTIGMVKYLINFPAAATLVLWPNTNNSINNQAINTSFNIPSGKGATLLCHSTTTWAVFLSA